ncbi:MAG: DUF4350 domain-containing protein [Gammaproteobacteria bacterium]
MKARLRAVLLALAALALLYGITFGSTPADRDATRPTSFEVGAGGYSALHEWLRSARIGTRSLRSDYGALDGLTSDFPTGNVLVVTLPGSTPLLSRDVIPLHLWVRRGNTLLVFAALCDAPDWASGVQLRALSGDIGMLTGLEAIGSRQGTGAFLATPEVSRWVPALQHPMLEGVRAVEAVSDRTVPPCALGLPPGRGALALLRTADVGVGGRDDGAWVLPRGDGWVVLAAQASPFSNRALGRADNARFVSNLIRGSLAPGGIVIFDDGLQGAPEPYDMRRLLTDPRLHASLAALMLLWLAWVAGGTRLRVPTASPRPPGAAALVAAEGRLLARAMEPAAASKALLDAFLTRLPESARAAPEEWLETRGDAAPRDIAQLRLWRRRLQDGAPVPLDALHDLLTRLRSPPA